MKNRLASFINSSDGFEDCWPPFFRLFTLYGDALRNLPVYLNTERSHYAYPGLQIIPTKVWPGNEINRPAWSECLLRGLQSVQEPYVIYFQEDYFLKRTIEAAQIVKAVELLDSDPEVGVVYLNKYGPQFHSSKHYGEGFVEVCDPARYLVSTQAAVWRKDFLQAVICPWESGWTFEKFASLRVRRLKKKLLSVSPATMSSRPGVDYIYTGIIKGRWKQECVDLFDRHNIVVDFSRRGFYKESGRLKTRYEVFKKAIAHPSALLRSLMSLVNP